MDVLVAQTTGQAGSNENEVLFQTDVALATSVEKVCVDEDRSMLFTLIFF
jgi:hypothetical protein